MKIFHLALPEQWREAEQAGTYRVSTLGLGLDEVGFVHCAQREQVDGVHDRFYSEVGGPVLLLTIDTDRLTSPWRLDPVPGEPLPFPHVYGPIDVDAVVQVETFRPSAAS